MAKWPTDKELEEIYRKGSENHNFEYDPKAWEGMTVLLDKKDNRKVIFFIFLGLIFLSLSGIFFGTRNTSHDISKKGIASSTTKIRSTLPVEKEVINTANFNESLKKQNTKKDNPNNLLKEESKLQLSGNNLESNLANTKSRLPSNSTKEINTFSNGPLPVDAELRIDNHSNESSTSIESGAQFSKTDAKGLIEPKFDVVIPKLSYNLFTVPSLGLSEFSTKGYLNLPQADSLTYYVDEVMRTKSMLSLVGLIGAESSWTPTGEFSSIDYSIGLGINAQLGKKLGFTIGASYIRDLYIANKGDYKAKQEFWRQSEEPNYTSANCKMIEVNTGLSYYFNGWENDGIGIQIGVLSNFMLSEQYDYHFEVEDMNFSSSWTGSNKTWLNAIDISPIYRFSYGNKGNIELSPYFKIPLNGIGHGDVLLSSFGLRGRIRIL